MEDNGYSLEAVTAAIAGDKEGFQKAFSAALAGKVSDALEVKKVEIASSLLSPGLENNEVQGTEVEVNGSDAASIGAEATATETA